MYVTIIN